LQLLIIPHENVILKHDCIKYVRSSC
jgi:hypothetical protein